VLGRRELKLLVTWRTKMKVFLEELAPADKDDKGKYLLSLVSHPNTL